MIENDSWGGELGLDYLNCEPAQDVIADIISPTHGGMCFIAHPFAGAGFLVWDTARAWPGSTWNVTGYSGLEIWSDDLGQFKDSDAAAWDFWRYHLLGDVGSSIGDGLPERPGFPNLFPVALGNSDAHATSRVGNTFTFCWMPDAGAPGSKQILGAMAEGHCTVSNGPLLWTALGDARVGEVAVMSSPLPELVVRVDLAPDHGMLSEYDLGIFVDGAPRPSVPLSGGSLIDVLFSAADLSLTASDRYIIARVDRDDGAYRAITNPLWLEWHDPCDDYTCTPWVPGGCGAGSCASHERRHTRTCTPSACAEQEMCLYDDACVDDAPPPTECIQPGYEFCLAYEYEDCDVSIAINLYSSVNTIRWGTVVDSSDPYVVGEYRVGWIAADAEEMYYGIDGSACEYGGCDREEIALEGTRVTVTAPGTAHHDGILGYDDTLDWACWVWYWPFDPSYSEGADPIYVLRCYDDPDCGSNERCDKSGAWAQWACVPNTADGQACSSDSECTSGYCDNDGAGLPDDGWCFTPVGTYFDGQEPEYCEYSTGTGGQNCDERMVGDRLGMCIGVPYREEQWGDTCTEEDVFDVFECDGEGCACPEPLCDGLAAGEAIPTCASGETFFADECSAIAGGRDREDFVSRSATLGPGCTADAECDGVVAGMGNCSVTCLYCGDTPCDDGSFCNGVEFCGPGGTCSGGEYPCPGMLCRETDDQCVQCLTDTDCPDDGEFCNGQPWCRSDGVCSNGAPPCVGPALCDEESDACLPDCNSNGVPDGQDIAAGTSTDCNTNGIHDDCDIAASTSADADSNGVPDECGPDCNGNGVPDDLDIAAGASTDCNLNGTPDECELAGGDCNSNGVPGECDIVPIGTGLDCNTNGVPDECDFVLALQLAKLVAADGATLDYFGRSVSVSGDTVVVGAYGDDAAGFDSGSAYVFLRAGDAWAQQAKLTAADGAAGDHFGASVSVKGTTAVVGAWGDDDAGSSSGSAYVFVRNGGVWTQEDKLTAADAEADDQFGLSVSVSDDTAVVGSWCDDDAGDNSGSAYVFVRNSGVWTQQAKLTAADATTGDWFGYSVSVDGETAVVGARLDDDAGDASGSAYVFVCTDGAWAQQAKLTAVDAAAGDWFGYCVSVSGDTAVVGAPYDDDAGANAGSAYVFVRSGGVWTQQAKLIAPDASANDGFGRSAAVNGDTVVNGAREHDDAGTDSGSAYVFVRTGDVWAQQAKLTAADAAAGDWFGISIAVGGDTVVVGAHHDDDMGISSGSAYVFAMPALDCNTNGIPDECDIAAGTSNDADGDGVPDECLPTGGCSATLSLNLAGENTCFSLGENIVVTVDVTGLTCGMVGAQFFLTFDPACWNVDTVQPDGGISPGDGWEEFVEIVDNDEGSIAYAVGRGDPAGGDMTLATITMVALSEDCACELAFDVEHQPPITLAPPNPPHPPIQPPELVLVDEAVAGVVIDETGPTCPPLADITTNNDPGACSAVVDAQAPPACTDNCDTTGVECECDRGGEACFTPDGFPVGETPLLWTCSDDCGNSTVSAQHVVVLDLEPPVLVGCTNGIEVPSDPGTCGAVVTWPEVTCSDNCGCTVTCTHNSGDFFPGGTTPVCCTAEDPSGNITECCFDVTVEETTEVLVTVELAGAFDVPLTRCITFELFDCAAGGPPVTVEEEIEFTGSGGLAPTGSSAFNVPCGTYTCITARDELHSLRRTDDDDFGIVGDRYEADFTNRSSTGGDDDALIVGNLNDDCYIDIVDWGMYVGCGLGSAVDPDTDCATPAPHCDLNGDGEVDSTFDASFIILNFFMWADVNCCGFDSDDNPLTAWSLCDQGLRAVDGPRTEISVRALRRLGLDSAMAADLNHDGMVDVADIVEFLDGARPGDPVPGPAPRLRGGGERELDR